VQFLHRFLLSYYLRYQPKLTSLCSDFINLNNTFQTDIQLHPLEYDAFNTLDPSEQVTLQQVFVSYITTCYCVLPVGGPCMLLLDPLLKKNDIQQLVLRLQICVKNVFRTSMCLGRLSVKS
jgi:hypothetical protein